MAKQKQDDQLELIYSSYVSTQDNPEDLPEVAQLAGAVEYTDCFSAEG